MNKWPILSQLSSTEFFKSLLLSFSPNLDEFNPDIPEWRQDVGRVIKKALLQVSDFHFLCPSLSLSFGHFVSPSPSLPIFSPLTFSPCYFSIISNAPITAQYSGFNGAVSERPRVIRVIHHQTGVKTPLLSFSPNMALWLLIPSF